MARGPLTFRQRDVAAAAKAAQDAGLTVYRVEVDKHGKIVVITSPDAPSAREGAKEWEEAYP